MHRGKPRTILPFFATKYIDFTSSVFKYSVRFCNFGGKKATKITTTTTTKQNKKIIQSMNGFALRRLIETYI